MTLLLDTQGVALGSRPEVASLGLGASTAERRDNVLLFSAASLWEVAIKRTLGRDDFKVEPLVLRRGLLDNGYVELPITGLHTLGVEGLPALHKDPFDRILLAQAIAEGVMLVTHDEQLARYPGPVRLI